MYDVKGSRAIITGGAQGFGREFGIRLAGEGCKVCLADLDETKGVEAKEEIQKRFNLGDESVCFVRADVTVADDWSNLWDEAERILGGKIDILANNAGINPTFGWELNMEVMLVGATRGVMLAVDRMGKSKGGNGGRIINTASMAGVSVAVLGGLEASGYTISKNGVVALTRLFRSAFYHEEGVKCYTLAPWFADTQLVRSQLKKAKEEKVKNTIRGSRVTSLEELSRAVHTRIMKVEEVGEAFMSALRIDKNGAVFAVMPDSPLIEYPNYKNSYGSMLMMMAKLVGGNLGLDYFGPIHFYSVLMLLVIVAYILVSSFLSFLS